jgi:hypothetical protein
MAQRLSQNTYRTIRPSRSTIASPQSTTFDMKASPDGHAAKLFDRAGHSLALVKIYV